MPEEIVGRVLRLVGYTAYRREFHEEASSLTIWVGQVGSRPLYTCGGCGVGPREALALNRRLFKAYYLKEQIERLWSYSYEGAAIRFLDEWVHSLRWQRLPAFQKLALTLLNHLEGLLAYRKHKVPFGVVEAPSTATSAL